MSASIQSTLTSCFDMPHGVDRRMICPECDPRRKHRGKKELSVKRTDDGLVYLCHHCGEKGIVRKDQFEPTIKPKTVERQPEQRPLSPSSVAWLRDRKISKETAKKAGCYTTTAYFRELGREAEAIAFPYKNCGVTYASKLRCLEAKDHTQIGAAQTLWLTEHIGDLNRIYITEGEPDALAMMEAGFENVVSVPNGAPSQHLTEVIGKENDRKFSYIWNAEKLLDQVDEIYLCGDVDKPGSVLTDELARRLGKHKCWRVTWPSGCKDANATLIENGVESIRNAVIKAERYPVAGLYEASTFFNEVEDLYVNGVGKGASTGYHSLDSIFTVLPGTLTVVTGIPSSGKSEILDQIAVNLAERDNWTIAFASFENEPRFHIAKLMQKRAGKHFFKGTNERMELEEARKHRDWVNDHFVFVYQADGSMATIDDIIERLTVAVVRHGIRMAVVDPMNYIERDRESSETQWVSDTLTKLRVFAQAHDVALFLVAHPQKLSRREDGQVPAPRGYDISGSAHYTNKSDFGLTVHIQDPQDRSIVQILNWKCRFNWAGQMGEINLIYNIKTTRYDEPPMEDFF